MASKRTETMRLLNCSHQSIGIQIRPPRGDFYLQEQQVWLRPNQNALLPKDHLNQGQITNLRAKRMLQVVYDSETSPNPSPA